MQESVWHGIRDVEQQPLVKFGFSHKVTRLEGRGVANVVELAVKLDGVPHTLLVTLKDVKKHEELRIERSWEYKRRLAALKASLVCIPSSGVPLNKKRKAEVSLEQASINGAEDMQVKLDSLESANKALNEENKKMSAQLASTQEQLSAEKWRVKHLLTRTASPFPGFTPAPVVANPPVPVAPATPVVMGAKPPPPPRSKSPLPPAISLGAPPSIPDARAEQPEAQEARLKTFVNRFWSAEHRQLDCAWDISFSVNAWLDVHAVRKELLLGTTKSSMERLAFVDVDDLSRARRAENGKYTRVRLVLPYKAFPSDVATCAHRILDLA
mmetsp:Transcript_181/g.552  ORF Transcript_181/g.552 Transcript_181/m.552 type:complete len:326 (-) Transcript_181:36-1013(-)